MYDETEPRWPLRSLGDVCGHCATWVWISTDCIVRTKLLLPCVSFFQHEHTPYFLIISPDLSVTVSVTLHCLTLTLSTTKRRCLTVRLIHTLVKQVKNQSWGPTQHKESIKWSYWKQKVLHDEATVKQKLLDDEATAEQKFLTGPSVLWAD